MRTLRSLVALLAVAASLAVPAGALAQSAGDEQYTDPFGQEEPAAPQEPAPEQPAEPPPEAAAPAPGGDGSVEPAPVTEADAAQEAGPTLPRTGAPVILLAAAGYALLLAGIAIRRKT